jgi:hypothetical protein
MTVSSKSATSVDEPKTTARPRAAARVRSLSRGPAQQAAKEALATNFRLPGTSGSNTRLRRLLGVSSWAAVLGFGGLVLVLRIMIGLFTTIAAWYLVLTLALGLVGITCTVGAFASVHKRRLPWLLLGGASAAELVAFAATVL